ncbi:hypothetical protein D3C72_564030 [compost metagenome]
MRIYLLFFCCLLQFGAVAQKVTNYDFTASQGTFEQINGTTMPYSQTNPFNPGDDDNFNKIPIGFTFHYCGQPYTALAANTNGVIVLTEGTVVTGYNSNSNGFSNGYSYSLLAPLWDDLRLNDPSDFSYQTTGTAGNRVLTLQYLNVRWGNGAPAPVISFQVKLYEADGHIEFLYRGETGAIHNSGVGYLGATIGIVLASQPIANSVGGFLSLSNSSSAPTISSTVSTNSINTKPADGQVYTFTPTITGVPNAPVSLTFPGRTFNTITLNWIDNSSNETLFKVRRSTDGINFVDIAYIQSTTTTTTGDSYSYTATGLNTSAKYYFQVVAANEGAAPSAALSRSYYTDGVPLTPEPFTSGSTDVCAPQDGLVYEVGESINATAYDWSYTGSGVGLVPNGKTITLLFTEFATSGFLSATGRNTHGNSSSQSLFINVKNFPITINLQPRDLTVCEKTDAKFSVAATGNNLTYQWQKSDINGQSWTDLSDAGNYSGVNTAELTRTNADFQENGIQYRCAIKSGCRTVNSSSAVLTVMELPHQHNFVISQNEVIQGQTNVLYRVADSPDDGIAQPGIAYQWEYSGTGVTINGSGDAVSLDFSNTATSGVLTLKTTNWCMLVGPATSLNITVKPLKQSQSITFNPFPAVTYGSAPVLAEATASSGLPVTYESSNLSIAVVEGDKIKILSTGWVTITAKQDGNDLFSPAPNVQQLLKVDKATLLVKADDKQRTYGQNNPGLTFSYSGFVNGDDPSKLSTWPTASTTADLNSPAGSFLITVNGGQSWLYDFVYQDGTLTINKAQLTVIAHDQHKIYGQQNPALIVDYTGFVNGDDQSAVTTLPVITTTATASSAVGTYPISVNGATASNYDFSYQQGSLVISKAQLTVKAEDKQKIYGQTNPALTISYTGFVNGDDASTFSTPATATTLATKESAVGTYTITAGGAASANYSFIYQDGVITVGKAALTITANNATKNAGAANPSFTASYNGFVNGETNTVLTAQPLISTSATTASPAGNYPIIPSGASAENYTISYVNGTLTINSFVPNAAPTLDPIADQTICGTTNLQSILLSGISAGPEGNQTITLHVSSDKDLFDQLSISGTGPTATLNYRVKPEQGDIATITVTVKDNGGVDNGGVDQLTRTFKLTVNPLPWLSITTKNGVKISKGDIIELTAAGTATQYKWDDAEDIIDGRNSATLTVRPMKTTTYTVKGFNYRGCYVEEKITIEVIDNPMLDATNVITPNGDGHNDKWLVKNIESYPNSVVKIFDKAGRILYTKTGYANDWDGTLNGAPLHEDTYYYVVDLGNGTTLHKGYITVIRD